MDTRDTAASVVDNTTKITDLQRKISFMRELRAELQKQAQQTKQSA